LLTGGKGVGVSLEGVLVAVAGFVGGFVSTLASNGSSVTLPALDLLGLPEHVANGTNRLSVVALGLVGTIHFYREGLVDWREGARIAVLIALGTVVGAFIAVDLSNAVLDAIVIAGLLLVLGMLLAQPGHWLQGKDGEIQRFGPLLLRHRRLRRPGRPRLGLLHARRARPAHGLRPEAR
jgi:uncharacterized protein